MPSTVLSQENLIEEKIPGTEVSFTMKKIEAGNFETEDGRKIEIDPFYMGTHEVTFDLFVLFEERTMDDEKTSNKKGYQPDAITRPTPQYMDMTYGMGKEGGYPAVAMTQQAALEFCKWLYLKTGKFYRLPTEAEWTYVALKGGQQDGDEYSWTVENSDDKYHVTGSKKPNDLDIYDMFGNVLEWTLDDWQDTPYATLKNPWSIPERKHYRVLKGGSYYDNSTEINAHTRIKSDRNWQKRDPQIPKSKWWLTDGSFIGFRIVSPVDQPSYEKVMAFFEQAIK